MKPLSKAITIALVHVLLVCSLGAKLLYDRATRPRVWVQTQNYDPNLPIRGRYVALRLMFDDPDPKASSNKLIQDYVYGRVYVENGKPKVTLTEYGADGSQMMWRIKQDSHTALLLQEPVLYFIPDTARDPSRLKPGEQLWVEVTIPKAGPPRPIRLAVISGDSFTPININ